MKKTGDNYNKVTIFNTVRSISNMPDISKNHIKLKLNANDIPEQKPIDISIVKDEHEKTTNDMRTGFDAEATQDLVNFMQCHEAKIGSKDAFEVLKLIINYGADYNIKIIINSNPKTLLDYIFTEGDNQIIQYLLYIHRNVFDEISVMNHSKAISVIQKAYNIGKFDILEALLEIIPNINLISQYDPDHLIHSFEQLDDNSCFCWELKHLKQLKIDINNQYKNHKNKTLLHIACEKYWFEQDQYTKKNYQEKFLMILNHQELNINAKDCFGRTALHIAAEKNNIHHVEHLLAHGAETDVIDFTGRMASDLTDCERIIGLIKEQSKIDFKSLVQELDNLVTRAKDNLGKVDLQKFAYTLYNNGEDVNNYTNITGEESF